MATVTCARCGFEVELVHVGGGQTQTPIDVLRMASVCPERIGKSGPLDVEFIRCPDLEAAISRATAAGRR
jgi:hypothetical protein